MTAAWAERQRNTNALARALAKHVFAGKRVTSTQLFGLAKLAWITNSYEGQNPAYVSSTKIPALGNVLGVNFGQSDISQVAQQVAQIVGNPGVATLVSNHTGFTNFYKAYRNSVADWVHENHRKLLPMFRQAYEASSSKKRIALVQKIASMPGIPKANHPTQLMHPENFLTPAFFVLDPQIRFPLINGNANVDNVLRVLGVNNASLSEQYDAVIRLYKVEGIRDAADVDQIGQLSPSDISDLIDTPTRKARKRILRKRRQDELRLLGLKDESDVAAVRKAGTVKQKQIHNQMTNQLTALLGHFELREGCDNKCMFDVQIMKYDRAGNDLLIEVKSSCEAGQIRMAIGQLFAYWHNLKGNLDSPHVAMLLPHRPGDDVVRLLQSIGIGLMWYHDGHLCTETSSLRHLTSQG